MDPNLVALVAFLGIALSLLSGKLFAYGVDKVLARRAFSKCRDGRCGELGWVVVRRDSESFHALCVECRWVSHFRVRQWRQLKRS
jgi:hypothetical protein